MRSARTTTYLTGREEILSAQMVDVLRTSQRPNVDAWNDGMGSGMGILMNAFLILQDLLKILEKVL